MDDQVISPDDGSKPSVDSGLILSEKSRSDMKLVQRAQSERWPVPDGARERLMARLVEMGEYEEPAIAIKAIALVQAGDRINQTDTQAEHESKVSIGTINQLTIAPEQAYDLIDMLNSKVINHEQ